MLIYDALVVGAGPNGLSAALELKKRGLQVLVLEKGSIVNTLYNFPTHQTFFSTSERLEIGDYLFSSANTKPTRLEALSYYINVVKKNDLNIKNYVEVLNVKKINKLFKVQTNKGTMSAKHVVLATGFYDNHKSLGIKGQDLPHVKYYFKEAHPYYNCDITIIGGRNSAVDAALELCRIGANVTVLYRGSSYSESIKPWILPEFKSRVNSGKIKMLFNVVLDRIETDRVFYWIDGKINQQSTDYVFAMIGYEPDYAFFRRCGIKLTHTGAPQYDPLTFESNIKGLFVAGVIISGADNSETFIENGRFHGKSIAKKISKSLVNEVEELKEEIIRIAIDGPAAAGKSTVAKKIAEEKNYIYIDTGAMYRSLTLKVLREKIDLEDEQAILDLLNATSIELTTDKGNQKVLLDNEDVTREIRMSQVAENVSTLAKHKKVREELVKRQQKLAEGTSVVMDGRDIGTHVLPQAELKVFLIASVKERAERRHHENLKNNYESNLIEIEKEIAKRDEQDRTRKVSPLVKASDAIEIDTTSLTIEDVVQKIISELDKVM